MKSVLLTISLFFALTIYAQETSSSKQIDLDVVEVSSKKAKKLAKKIEKLKNPKWLTVVGNKGFFVDNKSSYVANNSFEARQQNTGRLLKQTREELVYGNIGINRSSEYDYDRLEKRIVQLVLFRPDLKEMEIQIEANCEGYQDVQFLVLSTSDLKLIRAVNSQENFLKNFTVTEPTVFRKMQFVTKDLCQ